MSLGAQGNDSADSEVWLRPHRYQPRQRYFDVCLNPWHYTDWGGLSGIVSSHVLWATESGSLNDPSEVTRAADSLLRTWERTSSDLVPEAPKDEVDAWLRKMTSEVASRRFFFVSASFEGDKLQHWQSYAGGTGYAIEFAYNTEFRLLGRPLLYRPGFAPNPWWRPVSYGDYEAAGSPPAATLYGRDGIMEHILSEFAARDRGHRPDEQAFWEHLEAGYVSSVCFNKHVGYAAEEETRLAFVEPPFADFVHQRPSRYSPTGTVDYLTVTSDESDMPAYSVEQASLLPIASVTIGPRFGTDIEEEIKQVKTLLETTATTALWFVRPRFPTEAD